MIQDNNEIDESKIIEFCDVAEEFTEKIQKSIITYKNIIKEESKKIQEWEMKLNRVKDDLRKIEMLLEESKIKKVENSPLPIHTSDPSLITSSGLYSSS